MTRHRQDPDHGFTTIELMVVVLIIAILMVLGVVSLFAARRAAQDRAAQALAREALASAKTIFSAEENYLAATVPELRASEPGLNFIEGDQESDGPNEASVSSPDEATFIAAVRSAAGACFFIRDRSSVIIPVAERGTRYASAPSGSPCRANSPPATFADRW